MSAGVTSILRPSGPQRSIPIASFLLSPSVLSVPYLPMLPDAPCTLSTFPRESGQLCSPRGPVHFQSAPEPPKVHRFRRKFRPPDQPLYLLYVLLNLYTSRVCIGMGPYRGDSFRREY